MVFKEQKFQFSICVCVQSAEDQTDGQVQTCLNCYIFMIKKQGNIYFLGSNLIDFIQFSGNTEYKLRLYAKYLNPQVS